MAVVSLEEVFNRTEGSSAIFALLMLGIDHGGFAASPKSGPQ